MHGGALPVAAPLPDLSARRLIATEEKRRLAAAAVRLIAPGQVVFLDGGTTTAEIVRQIPLDMPLTVVTHAPTIAAELERHMAIEVVLIGGRLYRHSMVAVGPTALGAIERIRRMSSSWGPRPPIRRRGFPPVTSKRRRSSGGSSSAAWRAIVH